MDTINPNIHFDERSWPGITALKIRQSVYYRHSPQIVQ